MAFADLGAALPAGATGFGAPAAPVADWREFLRLCHHLARRTGGDLTDLRPAHVTPNFHTAVLRYRDDEPVAVLRHYLLPLLAFARSPDLGHDDALPFVDRPDLAAAVAEASELQVVTTAELATPLSRVDLTALGKDELAQFASWKPDTVGHVLFNYWD